LCFQLRARRGAFLRIQSLLERVGRPSVRLAERQTAKNNLLPYRNKAHLSDYEVTGMFH
jgi:hypothetical protein